MQTILGSGGAIGIELAKELKNYTNDIKLVSRHPRKVNETDVLFPADLSIKENVYEAVKGSEICYLTVGFNYSIKVWRENWPKLISNVVEACIKYKSKLVFFDNVYAIGGDNVKHMTEESSISPTSKKGDIRAGINKYILENIKSGKLTAIIARSPDFFGPVKNKSVMMALIYDNLSKGKKAQWFCNADVVHSAGYSPDLARATAVLGNTPDTFNQVWNLPVDKNALTGRQWISLFADEMNTNSKVQVIPAWSIKLMGLFVPVLRETYEMLYQYDRDYYFDSNKFFEKFNFSYTTNEKAVKQTVNELKK